MAQKVKKASSKADGRTEARILWHDSLMRDGGGMVAVAIFGPTGCGTSDQQACYVTCAPDCCDCWTFQLAFPISSTTPPVAE